MCLGADSHLQANRSHYLCGDDDTERQTGLCSISSDGAAAASLLHTNGSSK